MKTAEEIVDDLFAENNWLAADRFRDAAISVVAQAMEQARLEVYRKMPIADDFADDILCAVGLKPGPENREKSEAVRRLLKVAMEQGRQEGRAEGRENAEVAWDTLREIKQWAGAYPQTVFREPDKDEWKRVDEVLKANGLSLDRVSASNMRHVLSGLTDMVDKTIRQREDMEGDEG